MDSSQTGIEWVALQRDHERYEASALLIKLVAVVLTTLGIALAWPTLSLVAPLPILWLQEGIVRTSQARVGDRLLKIESAIARGEAGPAFRLHSEWQASRPGTVSLVGEYVRHAMRPTVAFPYVVLLAVAVVALSVR